MQYKSTEDKYRESLALLQRYHEDTGKSCIREQQLPEPDGRYLVDVIIPAYNVEKFIANCIHSVLRQKTKHPFQLILVDDGATDRTGEIIDRFREQENILIIHQKNLGLSGARNTGLLRSKSKYVMFLDSDDLLPPNAIDSLASRAEIEHADITAGSYCNFRGIPILRKNYYQTDGVTNSWLELAGHAWAKLYRRNLFNSVQFPEGYWFEDSLMHQVVFPCANKIVGVRDVVCLRRTNSNSITQNAASNPKSLDSLWVTLRLMEDRDKLGMKADKTYCSYLLRQARLTHIRLRGTDRKIREAAFTVMAFKLNRLFPENLALGTEETEIGQIIKACCFERFEKLCGC